MARHTAHVGTLTIASSGTDSNVLDVPQGKLSIALVFVGAAAYTGTITARGAMGAETPQALAIDGTAVTLVAAQTQRVNISGLQKVAIHSSGAEGSARSVEVYAEFDI